MESDAAAGVVRIDALRQVERAPELVRNDVPETLKQAITASLSPDPRERPASAGALASTLRQLPG